MNSLLIAVCFKLYVLSDLYTEQQVTSKNNIQLYFTITTWEHSS